MALDEYRQLEPPVTLADIRQRKDELLALRQRIQARAGGQPIYFPWIPYRGRAPHLPELPGQDASASNQLVCSAPRDVDQEAKAAVEALAMNLATEFYSKTWDVQDVHGTESYDLICRRGREKKHVEVKGTTTDGAEVILTPNEVRHAQDTRAPRCSSSATSRLSGTKAGS